MGGGCGGSEEGGGRAEGEGGWSQVGRESQWDG